jgi:uncharacterized glyoxalase superfamily protein PhnB
MPQPTTPSTVTLGMLYRDAPKAIEWLCNVFGFEKHAVYPGPNNTIMHAELTLQGGMVMLGSLTDDSAYRNRLFRHPDEIGGGETRYANICVEDADAVYKRAKAAGAEMIFDIEDKNYGGRGFTCRDLEGYTWNVGTYNPWESAK